MSQTHKGDGMVYEGHGACDHAEVKTETPFGHISFLLQLEKAEHAGHCGEVSEHSTPKDH